MQKEGIQAAIDFTKYIITMAAGAVAFVIKPEYVGSGCLKYLSILILVLLSASVIAGLFVFSAGCLMLARGNYDLEDNYIKIPGQINVITFAVSFLLLAFEVGVKIFQPT